MFVRIRARGHDALDEELFREQMLKEQSLVGRVLLIAVLAEWPCLRPKLPDRSCGVANSSVYSVTLLCFGPRAQRVRGNRKCKPAFAGFFV